jgi:hypothetical protein
MVWYLIKPRGNFTFSLPLVLSSHLDLHMKNLYAFLAPPPPVSKRSQEGYTSSSPLYLDRLWGPPSLLTEYRGHFPHMLSSWIVKLTSHLHPIPKLHSHSLDPFIEWCFGEELYLYYRALCTICISDSVTEYWDLVYPMEQQWNCTVTVSKILRWKIAEPPLKVLTQR